MRRSSLTTRLSLCHAQCCSALPHDRDSLNGVCSLQSVCGLQPATSTACSLYTAAALTVHDCDIGFLYPASCHCGPVAPALFLLSILLPLIAFPLHFNAAIEFECIRVHGCIHYCPSGLSGLRNGCGRAVESTSITGASSGRCTVSSFFSIGKAVVVAASRSRRGAFSRPLNSTRPTDGSVSGPLFLSDSPEAPDTPDPDTPDKDILVLSTLSICWGAASDVILVAVIVKSRYSETFALVRVGVGPTSGPRGKRVLAGNETGVGSFQVQMSKNVDKCWNSLQKL